jgi:Predicted permease
MTISTGSWIRGVVVVALAFAAYMIRDVFIVILASIVIASAVEPAASFAKKRGFPRLPTILAVYVVAATLFAGLFYFLFLPLLGEVSGFISGISGYTDSLSAGSLSSSFDIVNISDQLNTLLLSFSQGVVSSASLLFGGITSFLLIVILSFYLAVEEDGVGKFLRIVTPVKREKYILDLWNRSRQKIGLWMQGQLLMSVIIAVLAYLGLLLIGLPNALLLAVGAGLFEIIPVFGPILAAIPAVIIGFGHGGMSMVLLVIGLFVIIQQFENQLIYPLVVKKVIGVPPMVSILALIIGAKLAGFLGMIISVPLAAIFIEFISDLEKGKLAKSSDVE